MEGTVTLDELAARLEKAEVNFLLGRDERGWWAHVSGEMYSQGDEGRGATAQDALFDAIAKTRNRLIAAHGDVRKKFEAHQSDYNRKTTRLSAFEMLLEDEP